LGFRFRVSVKCFDAGGPCGRERRGQREGEGAGRGGRGGRQGADPNELILD